MTQETRIPQAAIKPPTEREHIVHRFYCSSRFFGLSGLLGSGAFRWDPDRGGLVPPRGLGNPPKPRKPKGPGNLKRPIAPDSPSRPEPPPLGSLRKTLRTLKALS